MNKIGALLFTASILISSLNIHSQNSKQAPCSSKEYKQFDFWLGNWEVFDVKNKLIGTNRVVKMPNACAIQENWASTPGPSLGTSYNYYNAQDKSWNQLWIDNTEGSLELKGKKINNKMILKSALVTGKKGAFYNQITWTDHLDGTVQQLWELKDKNNNVVKEVFRGTYKKKTN